MTEPKTTRIATSVADFLDAVEDPQRRADAIALNALMREATGTEPAMWGTAIVGFGSYRYRYASGREGEWPAAGFSPRKQQLVVYIGGGFDQYATALANLGKHTIGKSCLYIKRLADVEVSVKR